MPVSTIASLPALRRLSSLEVATIHPLGSQSTSNSSKARPGVGSDDDRMSSDGLQRADGGSAPLACILTADLRARGCVPSLVRRRKDTRYAGAPMSVLNAAQQRAVAELLRVSPLADEL